MDEKCRAHAQTESSSCSLAVRNCGRSGPLLHSPHWESSHYRQWMCSQRKYSHDDRPLMRSTAQPAECTVPRSPEHPRPLNRRLGLAAAETSRSRSEILNLWRGRVGRRLGSRWTAPRFPCLGCMLKYVSFGLSVAEVQRQSLGSVPSWEAL